MKNIFFYLKFFIFLVVKFSVYLNRHVFVMYFISVYKVFPYTEPLVFCHDSVIAL